MERKKLILLAYIQNYIALHYMYAFSNVSSVAVSSELMKISILPINILINFRRSKFPRLFRLARTSSLRARVFAIWRTSTGNATQHFQTHVDLVRWRAVVPEMTSGDQHHGGAGNVGGEGSQRLLEGAEGLQRVAHEDVECRGSISARVSSDEGKEKKKKKGKREGEKARENAREEKGSANF